MVASFGCRRGGRLSLPARLHREREPDRRRQRQFRNTAILREISMAVAVASRIDKRQNRRILRSLSRETGAIAATEVAIRAALVVASLVLAGVLIWWLLIGAGNMERRTGPRIVRMAGFVGLILLLLVFAGFLSAEPS